MNPGSNLFGDTNSDGTIDENDTPVTVIATGAHDFPQLAAGRGDVDQDGTLDEDSEVFYLTAADGAGTNGRLRVARSLNAGASWSSLGIVDVDADGTAETGVAPTPTVAADGKLFVAYLQAETDPDLYRYNLVVSANLGSSFAFTGELDDVVLHLPHPDQNPYFDDYVPGSFRVPSIGWIAAHPSDADRLYFVYADRTGDEVGDPPDGDMDIYFMRSLDAGQTWTTPQRVNQDGPWNEHPEYYDQFMPRIAVDDSATGTADRVHIIWYDTRNDPRANDDPDPFDIDLYYAFATDRDDDNALDFSNNERKVITAIDTGVLIAQTPQFIGDYNGLVISQVSTGTLVVPVYMATALPLGPMDAPEPDDAILSNRVVHSNP